MPYKIIEEDNPLSLEREMNRLEKEGYELVGSIVSTIIEQKAENSIYSKLLEKTIVSKIQYIATMRKTEKTEKKESL